MSSLNPESTERKEILFEADGHADPDEIARALSIILSPGQLTELRALGAVASCATKPGVVAGFFNNCDALVTSALHLDRAATGLYVIPNPVREDLLERCRNSLGKGFELTKDGDVLVRRWFYLDLDPVRPDHVCATEEEHDGALLRAIDIAGILEKDGWPRPCIFDSGNGMHLLYAIDLPNDGESARLVKSVLANLADRFDDEFVKIDRCVHNSARLIRLPGTMNRKGPNTRERPHRSAAVLEIAERTVVSLQLLRQVIREKDGHSRNLTVAPNSAKRIPQGQRHTALLSLAGTMVKRGMDESEVQAALIETNKRRCDPPIAEADVVRLVADVVQRYGKADDDLHGDDLPDLEPEAAEFPIHIFPTPLARFVSEAAIALTCPADYIAVPMLAVLGYALGTNRRLEIKPGWEESALLYTAIVGAPGTTKSPALRLAIEPLIRLQEQFLKEYVQAKQHSNENEDTPVLRQCFTTDSTLESLATILRQNPRGMVFVRDELTGWAQAMDQYRNGKGADREAWLSIWSGTPLVINRKNLPEPIIISRPFVSVTGCLPPDMLSDLSDEKGREDGFLHRILFSFPDSHPPSWTDAGIGREVQDDYCTVFDAMRRLRISNEGDGAIVVKFTTEARGAFVAWVSRHYQEMKSLAPHLYGAWAKFPTHFGRLAVILHQASLACNDVTSESADEITVARTVSLVEYFKTHARKVYSRLRATPQERRFDEVVQWVRRKPGSRATAREVYTAKVGGCRNSADVERVFGQIQKLDIGRVKELHPPGGGRKSTVLELCDFSIPQSVEEEAAKD